MDQFGRFRQFGMPDNRPSSPPATPRPGSFSQFSSASGHTSPFYQKSTVHSLATSPPDDNIKPIGQGPHFLFSRLQAEDRSSLPSSASGFASAGSLRPITPDVDAWSEVSDDQPPIVRRRTVQESDLTIEEINDNDEMLDSDVQVVKPDPSDDSDNEEGRRRRAYNDRNVLLKGFQQLHCDSSDDEAQRQRYLRKKKRWSAGLFKRSHSQSVGSDTDLDDTEGLDAQDVGSSARRLRRRVKGPEKRASLIFDENPRQHILEVEEPEEGFMEGEGNPSPLDLNAPGHTLETMPFWVLEDPMEIDTDSGRSSAK